MLPVANVGLAALSADLHKCLTHDSFPRFL
jgi:hypothetical protein